MNNGLLIPEPPLQVLPSLACKVGLNESIVLQQFHYWLQRSNNIKDGYKWIYNSYKEWAKQFPFWSEHTIRRTINSLETQGYLISGNYNKAGFDKTKWYRIDYERLYAKPYVQNGQTISPTCTTPKVQNGQTNTNRLPENTTDKSLSSTACNSLDNSTKDIESRQNAFELYQITVGVLTPTQNQILSEYIQNLSDEVVQFAINSMANQTERRSFNYLNKILMKYEQLGIHTVEQAEKLEKQHQESLKRVRPKQKKKTKRKNTLPF